MTTAIGVLTARVRVEEKLVMAALERAGVYTMPIPPAAMPLPPNPTLHDVQQFVAVASGNNDAMPLVMIDRIANRSIGRMINRLFRQAGVTLIDAGVASRRNRLQAATVWAASGVPRPAALAAFSESMALAAANQLGYPATMLPLSHSSAPVPLLDADTADAVIEHRVVLGTDEEEIVLMQGGAAAGDATWFRLHVAGFTAIGVDGEIVPPAEAVAVAEHAARAIDAGSIAVDVALIDGRWVAWDAIPVADFRKATLLGETTVEDAIAAHALRKLMAREQEVRDVALA
ncbi:MAG: hypothetical protein M9909_04055 [Thermomicrobiales bacterium]|nr:hypothetical protein [Thermomicrobiales bacterium]